MKPIGCGLGGLCDQCGERGFGPQRGGVVHFCTRISSNGGSFILNVHFELLQEGERP